MTRASFVYFIATADRSMVKIGCSYCPEERLRGLSVWSPVLLSILAAVPGNYDDERALHARYVGSHSHREWFRSDAGMLADIEAIGRFGELPTAFKGKKGQKNLLITNPITSIRATPEWRAKISEIHKARWVREKAERALKLKFSNFLETHCMSAEQFNDLCGDEIAFTRPDGSHFLFTSDAASQERVAAVMASYAPDQQARAS